MADSLELLRAQVFDLVLDLVNIVQCSAALIQQSGSCVSRGTRRSGAWRVPYVEFIIRSKNDAVIFDADVMFFAGEAAGNFFDVVKQTADDEVFVAQWFVFEG